MRIAVLSSPDAWHFRDLKRASGDKFDVFNFRFEDLCAQIDSDSVSSMGHFNLQAECVIVRTMPPGSLEQIVFRMDLLARLERCGMTVLNPPKTIEASVDKYLSLALLNSAGVPVPKTKVSQTLESALEHFDQLGKDSVVKPIFGSMGNGIERLQNQSDAKSYFESAIDNGRVIYQQEFIEHAGYDVRLLVIGDRVLGMKRSNTNHWITNISKGGRGERYCPTEQERELAIESASAVGARFAGVDLVYESKTGRQFVVEVNAVPGWRATSRVLEVDVAELILQRCFDEVQQNLA